MTLREKRVRFTWMVSILIQEAFRRGFLAAIDEVKRSEEACELYAKAGIGIANSLHRHGLAIDLLLYEPDGTYLKDTEDYADLGRLWKSLDPLARWGGDFSSRPDGNHFSLEHNGVR